ncbi:Fusarisetin A cluster transcription factor [Lachnellula subtilissima]|uniref:Fusarisetin A cluster transcription factor n=1 Tax=Lachnellula subtilissima TaxID=602034 RepID=A0A8H8RG61_9HELO|nr:Fusarisetin A cluster transcription factor [Lachnellula subtilissima]
MRDRVRHLEGLVKGALAAVPLSENEGEASGQVLTDSDESRYVGSTHWAAILEDIEEVKDYFADAGDVGDEEAEEVVSYTMLTFKPYSPISKEELLGRLPEKNIVDGLVRKYFNGHSPSLHLIHKPTFQKEYKLFWAAPSDAPVIWVGLIYSMMALAAFSSFSAAETPIELCDTPMETIRHYRNCCMQALLLSHYTKPGPYTIETLILYMEGEFLMSKDDQVHLYLLVGNIVRLCLRMGLHRDTTKVGGNITPFQAEMRRRVWHHLSQIDLLASFQIGLPGMVESIESDTLYPRNLRDEDVDEGMTELPPSRPDSELTPISYLISKSRLCHACGQIATLANRLTLSPYTEVMKMDGLLHEAYATIPSFFQMPLEFSLFESPGLIIKQFSLALVYQKSRCMLHRKYIMKQNENPHYAYSKKVAVDASMELLKCQAMSYDATFDGGALARDRWVLSTLTTHDFLLASMIVTINIMQTFGPNFNNRKEVKEVDLKMVEALEKSHSIFTQSKSVTADARISSDARKASALLRAMLNKVYRALGRPLIPVDEDVLRTHGESKASNISDLSLSGGLSPHDVSSKNKVPISGTWDTGYPDNMAAPTGLDMQLDYTQAAAATDPLGAMIDVDWDTFDNHIFPKTNLYDVWPNFSSANLTFDDFDNQMLNTNPL